VKDLAGNKSKGRANDSHGLVVENCRNFRVNSRADDEEMCRRDTPLCGKDIAICRAVRSQELSFARRAAAHHR
jgi:hypothetical protein